MKNIDSYTLKKLLNNPHYKLKEEQPVEVYTQDVRSDDSNVIVPKVRKKRAGKSNRDTVSNKDIRSEVPQKPDVS